MSQQEELCGEWLAASHPDAWVAAERKWERRQTKRKVRDLGLCDLGFGLSRGRPSKRSFL